MVYHHINETEWMTKMLYHYNNPRVIKYTWHGGRKILNPAWVQREADRAKKNKNEPSRS